MNHPKPTPTKWLTGEAQPPLWFRLIGAVLFIALPAGLWVKRGVAVGLVAAIVYGFIALSTLLAWQQISAWSKRHPLLDGLIVVPLLFLAVAYLTHLSTGVCVLIAVLAGAPLVGLSAARRHRRIRRT